MSNTGQIKRYDPTMDGDCRFQTHGEFVKYDDHVRIVNDLEQRLAELEKELNDYKVALCEYANQLCKIKDVVSGFNNGIQILACDGMVNLTLSEYNLLVQALNATE